MKPDGTDWEKSLPANPRETALYLALGYAVVGGLAMLFLEGLLPAPVGVQSVLLRKVSWGQGLFMLLSSTLVYVLIWMSLARLQQVSKKSAENRQVLEAAYEELTAVDEALKQQYAVLAEKTDLLEKKDRELWSLFEHMHDGFALHEILCDEQGRPVDYRFLATNSAFERLVGRDKEQLVGQRVRAVMPLTDQHWIDTYGRVALTGEPVTIVEKSQELDRYYSVRAYCPQRGQFATLALDVTEQRQQAETIRRLAYYDGLTGMPNREYFSGRLKAAMEQDDAAGAVLCIRLDDVGTVNDVFGHAFGDVVIITAGTYIVAEAGDDAFAARTGGSEFAVLLPGQQDRAEIAVTAQNIIRVLARQCELGESSYDMSASIGIALYPEDGQTSGDILKNAAAALHIAQKAGIKNWRFYQCAMQQDSYQRIVLCGKLRGAAAKGELYMTYQPQVTAAGELIGFEALLRWQSPEHGLVPPDRFIPLAEANHLIQPIGEWVLRDVCRFLRKLTSSGGGHLTVAVNVSPHQLAAGNFIDLVRDVLTEFSVPPHQLELEITETVLMTSLDENNKKLKELQGMGIKLSLDDFGTGYSSLTYLQNLPVETLKIDKSFIDTLLKDGLKSAMIRSIIEMAHALNLTVVAEGVETEEQWRYLVGCRCDRLQGYYFGRPLTEEQVLAKTYSISER